MINEFESSMCFIIGTTRKMILKQLNETLLDQEMPLTFEQFVFLYHLHKQQQPVTQQNMADLTGKDKSAVLRTIDILQKKGLVIRSDDELDRRKKIITLSPKCEQLLGQIIRLQSKTMDRLKEGINDEEYDTMVRVMHQIQANANKPLNN